MLSLAHIGTGSRVIDLATGTGEPAIPAAERVGATGSVLAMDFAEPMLAIAREKVRRRGLENVEFRLMDGDRLEVPAGTFDAFLCRFGIMFMLDPEACLHAAWDALRSGGHAVVATWARPDHNPWASGPLSVLRRYTDVPVPPPDAPGLFKFADPDRLRRAMVSAGFDDVTVEEFEVDMGGPWDDEAAFTDWVLEVAGPLAALLRRLDPEQQITVRREIADEVGHHRRGGKVVVPGVALLAHGRR